MESLLTPDEAGELLGADELGELVEAGEVRLVTHDGTRYVLGADVQAALDDMNPRKLAARVPRPGGSRPGAADPDVDRIPRL